MSQPENEEIVLYVTNRQQSWECKIAPDRPYLTDGYVQRIEGDSNPHHWAYKVFKAFKNPGPNLVKTEIGKLTFYTPKVKTDKLTTYWACSQDNKKKWWILAPNEEEIKKHSPSKGSNFWNWTIEEEFYTLSDLPVWACKKCSYQNMRLQEECEMCSQQREREGGEKGEKLPTIKSKPLQDDEISIVITNRRWESRAWVEKPQLGREWSLGFPDSNAHHWAFKAFRAWKTPAPGRIKVRIDKIEFYAYQDRVPKTVRYYVCQKPYHGMQSMWWIFCPTYGDRNLLKRTGSLYGWQLVSEFFALADREAEEKWLEREDRGRWECEGTDEDECGHVNPGYRTECECCYFSRLKEEKGGADDQDRGQEERSSYEPTGEKSTYALSPPKKYQLPFKPGTPSKASILDLIRKEKEKEK